jgi:hypothetical protein
MMVMMMLLLLLLLLVVVVVVVHLAARTRRRVYRSQLSLRLTLLLHTSLRPRPLTPACAILTLVTHHRSSLRCSDTLHEAHNVREEQLLRAGNNHHGWKAAQLGVGGECGRCQH